VFVKFLSRKSGFTLVELLVVISILGILAALIVPALKNFGNSDATLSATRQLLGDVARARQLAMSQRTTVYMVFVPTNFWNANAGTFPNTWWGNLTVAQKIAATNLCDKQLTGYAFVSLRTVGDQPGHNVPHYLIPWQTLPDGAFIAQQKFIPPSPPAPSAQSFYISSWDVDYHSGSLVPIYGFNTNNSVASSGGFPFPTADAVNMLLPYVAFNSLGQLTVDGQNLAPRDEYIPLARGGVAPAIDPTTRALQLSSPTVSETPPGNSTNSYNIIHIDAITGRATEEYLKVK
jgi:prepilin-type N-terminal cleavage/methylation domain-containing protein